jgi:peptide/nickel transport system substrate-binding protein
LKFVPHADLKVLDPIWTTAAITHNHANMIYDVLLALDENLKTQPQMVDSWQISPDGLQYTFTLRDGLQWHDGQPVTAEDAVASLQRWGKKDGVGQLLMKFTANLETVDTKTFRLTLKEPFGLVLYALSKEYLPAYVMPARIAVTPPDEQIKETIGSGPFKFVKEEWQPGHKVVYVPNKEYVPRPEPANFGAGGKRVYVDRVEWFYIPDPSTASAALEKGEVDYWESVPLDFIPILEKKPNIMTFMANPRGAQGWLRPNHLQPPFNHPKARQALLWMVNQETYMSAAAGEKRFWRTCPSYYMCESPYATDAGSEPLVKQDFEKAKQLLKEAGYDGRPVVVLDPTDLKELHAFTLVTAQLLTKIGVKVDLQAMDWSTLVSRRAEKKPPAEGGWNIFHTTWSFELLFSPAINRGFDGCEGAWFGWNCNEQMNQMREAWVRTTDEKKQKEMAAEMQKLMFQEVSYVPLGEMIYWRARRDHVKGVLQFPASVLWNIWLDK